MDIRHSTDPTSARHMTTADLRDRFLLESIFREDGPSLYYVETDRLIVGGVQPASSTSLSVEKSVTGTDYLLQRRELGIINVGPTGEVTVDGEKYELENLDVLYVSAGTKEILFDSSDRQQPARFYFVSAPSHAHHPTRKMTRAEAETEPLGEGGRANRRTIYRYIHTGGIESSQLVMGFTRLEEGSVWNTMPPHTHPRRSEVYLYFDVGRDDVVFHFMGAPDETKHLVVRDGQAVSSPSWSIHAGAGTRAYSFVWAMAGENQTFADMDGVPLADIG